MVQVKSPSEIARMQAAGAIAAQVMAEIKQAVRPGVTTAELDRLAERRIKALGGRPAFKGLYGFPASICASLNHEVVHGVPGTRQLVPGDLLKVDIGVSHQGYCADMACSIGVGEVSAEAQRLLTVTAAALDDAVAMCGPGRTLGDVGAAVQRRAEVSGFSVVRDYGGHGIGRRMHEEPWIGNFGVPNSGLALVSGMTLALEPMINVGGSDVMTVNCDGWPVIVTADGTLSAHFEHTVAVTDQGPLVLTARGG